MRVDIELLVELLQLNGVLALPLLDDLLELAIGRVQLVASFLRDALGVALLVGIGSAADAAALRLLVFNSNLIFKIRVSSLLMVA